MAIDLTLDIQSKPRGSTAADCVINKPTGTVDGDILLMGFSIEFSTTFTPPADLNTIATFNNNGLGDLHYYVYWKRASSEPASYTWSHAVGIRSFGSIWRINGTVASGSPIDAGPSYIGNGQQADLTVSQITTATAGAAVVIIGFGGLTVTSATLTSRFSNVGNCCGGDIQASAGPTGAKHITGASQYIGGCLLALRSASQPRTFMPFISNRPLS